jgi:alpha-D-ribose 1-methylphosphonate 5-triphosphate diphosphatase
MRVKMQKKTLIQGANVLTEDVGLVETEVLIDGGFIESVGDSNNAEPASCHFDATGLWLLPGIIDIHGDGFEHLLMPRSGVRFPTSVALAEVDKHLLANGITTAYHGVTYSWEPGLRGREAVVDLMRTIHAIGDSLGCDTRLHLRYEMYNLDGESDAIAWLQTGQIGLLSFNEHIEMILERLGRSERLSQYTERSGLDANAYRALVEKVASRADEVSASVARISQAAISSSTPLASHDDETPEIRRHFRSLGSTICEFPCNKKTALEAMAAEEAIVLGAPNVLRGGSHDGRLDAESAISEGLCSVLASDYYYPASVYAAFQLVERGMDISRAWSLLSRGPADAVGLGDRGSIAPGKRADFVLIEPGTVTGPAVRATMVHGNWVYSRLPGTRESGSIGDAKGI